MAAIALPTMPGPNQAQPVFLHWGGEQKAALGGGTTHIDRLGSRFGLDVVMPAMETEPGGRIWVAQLLLGKLEGAVLFEWPQLSFTWNSVAGSTATGQVRVAAAALTYTLPLKGLGAAQAFALGQFVSVIRAATGRRYLYMIAAAAVATGGGNVDLTIAPMIRAGLAVNDVVEIAIPIIEGSLTGDANKWNLSVAHHTGLAFGIEENE